MTEASIILITLLSRIKEFKKKHYLIGKKMQINLLKLMDEQACYQLLREIRWPDGVQCTSCGHLEVKKAGFHDTHPYRQRYECRKCETRFDDLTDTVFSGSKKTLKTWLVCLYLMGLNLSNLQISKELDMSEKTAQEMTTVLREGIVKKNLISSLAEWLRPTRST